MTGWMKRGAAGAGRDGGRRLLLAVWLLVFCCAGTAPTTAQTWKFLVYGDTRGESTSAQINTTILAELARATTNEKPVFVLVPGDLVYAAELSAFQDWTNILAPVYEGGIQVYPILGGHDASDVDAYLQVFGAFLPTNGPAGEVGRTYAMTCSNVLVLGLDTSVNFDQVNQTWIDLVLATNVQPHVFVMGHVPAFKVNHTDCLDDYPSARDAFWQSLSNAHCRIYFAGHDHFYDHARLDDGDGNPVNDTHQIIVGTGGAPLHGDGAYDGNNGFWTPERAGHEGQYGYLRVEMDGNQVTTTWVHRVGADQYADTTEVFSYLLPPARPILAGDWSGDRLTLTWTPGVLQAATNVGAGFADVPGASSPFVITNFAQPQQFFRVRGY